MEEHEIESLVEFIIQKLGTQLMGSLSDEYYYQSLTLAAIDAVFSAQARYPSVQAVVQRYCQRYNFDRYRKQRECLPSSDSQEHISSLIQKMEQVGTSYFAESIFCNRSKTSRRLKADILLDLLRVVVGCGVQTFQDIQPILSDTNKQDELLERLTEIHGVGEATSRYFLMLSGSDQMVKPDTMILRFIKNALGRTVGSVEAVQLIQATSNCLSKSYPGMRPRRLDYLIWCWQRNQLTFKSADDPKCETKSLHIDNQGEIMQPRISASNNRTLTIPQQVQKSMHSRYEPGDLLSSSQIKDDVLADDPDIPRASVMPPDYCCNKWNKDPRSGIYHIFFYEHNERKYRLLPRVDITKPRKRGACQD